MGEQRPGFSLVMLEETGAWARIEQARRRVLLDRYFAWVDDLSARGDYLCGEGLSSTGHQLKVVGGQVVDGPLTETKEVVAGFFTVRADDLDAALNLARTCPALDHGRDVVVQRVEGSAEPHPPSQARALVLVWEPPDLHATLSPQAQQRLLSETLAWVQRMKSEGQHFYGEPLHREAHRVSGDGSVGLLEGEVPGAVHALRVSGLAEAVSLAGGCPALHFGARAVVQGIWDEAAARHGL